MNNEMRAPFFSVITPSWNQGKFLRACIESVVNQNEPDFEHLIFDNCSTDETELVAKEFPHVQFVSEADRGQSHAVNKGLAVARGEIICWLNSDDEYALGAFASLREAFDDPDVSVVFGDAVQVAYDGRGEVVQSARFGSRLDLVRWWRSDVKLHQPSVFFRRKVAEQTGLLREDLHLTLDYEYWWRISEHYEFKYLPAVLSIQHRQPESKTILLWRKALEEREEIFSPYYHLLDQGELPGLLKEKRMQLGESYLTMAYAIAPIRRFEAMRLLLRSFLEWPQGFLDLRWLGIFKRG